MYVYVSLCISVAFKFLLFLTDHKIVTMIIICEAQGWRLVCLFIFRRLLFIYVTAACLSLCVWFEIKKWDVCSLTLEKMIYFNNNNNNTEILLFLRKMIRPSWRCVYVLLTFWLAILILLTTWVVFLWKSFSSTL